MSDLDFTPDPTSCDRVDFEKGIFCDFCTGDSAVRNRHSRVLMTSHELCTDLQECTATIDWEKVYNGE